MFYNKCSSSSEDQKWKFWNSWSRRKHTLSVCLVRDTIETWQFYLTWLLNFFFNSMTKESSWKSFLSSSPQFQTITAFRSIGITLHSGGHINVEKRTSQRSQEQRTFISLFFLLAVSKQQPRKWDQTCQGWAKAPSQPALSQKEGRSRWLWESTRMKKQNSNWGKAPSHQCFGAPRVLKPQWRASLLQALLPTAPLEHTETSIWICKPAMKEDGTQAISATSSFITPCEKNVGFFRQHFFNFKYSILQLLQVFGSSMKLGAVFNNLMHQRNIKHERVFQKRLWLGYCFKWSPNFPTSEWTTAVNQAEDSGTLCQLGKPRASWFIHHLTNAGPGMEEVIGTNIFLMLKTTISSGLQ